MSMVGYENNDTVSDYIWDSLVQENGEDVTEQARAEYEPIPQVHADYLTSTEQQNKQENQIEEKVNRRIRLEHVRSRQD